MGISKIIVNEFIGQGVFFVILKKRPRQVMKINSLLPYAINWIATRSHEALSISALSQMKSEKGRADHLTIKEHSFPQIIISSFSSH